MTTYTLTVNIGTQQDYTTLRNGGYKLCIAKKVNDTYDTVWRGDTFLQYNQFQWTSAYQIFGTNTWGDGALVFASTKAVDIKFGQTALLDDTGTMNNATGTPNPSTGSFNLTNNYGGIRAGVNASLGGNFAPIFVSPTQLINGPATFTPVESVMVWFDTSYETSTIIASSVSDTIEVDFTGGRINRSVTYGGGAWDLDGAVQLSSTFHPDTQSFEVERPSAALLLKMAQMINKKGRGPADGASIIASLEFYEQDAQAGAVKAFTEYVKQKQPDGMSEWAVSAQGNIVEVHAALEGDADLRKAARKIPSKYLSVLHEWTGAQYKELTFAAPQA
ncbi:hypothetical protein OH77DRAFT_1418933 [Trametes cingulata]|nr:hypothetical protein OH77DRAFT_1418933 [Trametes cingulata]